MNARFVLTSLLVLVGFTLMAPDCDCPGGGTQSTAQLEQSTGPLPQGG